MLRCRDVSELASPLIEGDLSASDWVGVRFHLMICGMCRAYVGQVRATRILLRQMAVVAPSEAAEEEIIAAILNGRPEGRT